MAPTAVRNRLLPTVSVVVAVAVVAVASQAGCSGPQPVAPELVREVTDQEAGLLYDAEQLLIRACMTGRGFSYRVVPRNPVPEFREFPYVVDDVAWAKRYGYGGELQRRLVELSQSHPNKRNAATLSPERRRAWLGAYHGDSTRWLEAKLPSGVVLRHSDNGCVSEAEQRLYGDLRTWYHVKNVASDLAAERRGRVVADARFAAAMARWAQCMRRSGHTGYTSPGDIRAQVEKAQPPVPQKTQVRLAVAEASCADRSALAATARALDQHYAKALAERYPTDTAAKLRLELAAVPRARVVVARSEDPAEGQGAQHGQVPRSPDQRSHPRSGLRRHPADRSRGSDHCDVRRSAGQFQRRSRRRFSLRRRPPVRAR
ncbi:hypothetical protein ACWCPF_32400 [Streptomyces sp. NPDC001858]